MQRLIAKLKALLMDGTHGVAPHSPAFTNVMAALGLWFTGGVILDGWAHNHLDSALETFFTPWHGVMYSGFAACGIALLAMAIRGRRAGRPWTSSLPDGYFPSLIGAGVFAAGGGFDMFWHLTFGIEKDIEALLSPAHLVLAVGAVLMLLGPVRAAWRSAETPRGSAWIPVALSLACAVTIISFMSQFAHPVRMGAVGMRPEDGTVADLMQGRAVAGIIVQLALLTGAMLLAARRWGVALPRWFFTFVFGANAFAMHYMTDVRAIVPAAAFAGLLADLKLRRLRPAAADTHAFRNMAVSVPAEYALLYFVFLMGKEPLWWSVHMWTGTVAVAGITGLLLSYVLIPPPSPQQAK